jgi:hypothetical protein
VDGEVLERPLRLEGAVGDSWRLGKNVRYTVFGYDRIEVLGEERRALVVACDRDAFRDLYWFAAGIGWVRFRTEHMGAVRRDVRLVEFTPGAN